ncbi:phage tail tube protein [Acetobacter estunensis]|uniref:phage tail tube protein n=1 Tax=Acetobacter estunensis TaxID=104097 RepID=UPI001C2DE600|nr:phage tail tube protein [Acetobacter estunensis]MBV1835656.1 phage tail tube protein [Acetobacter estunensis]MBV1836083.1 phage tail tube protein [Acetobacter estunensis]
MSGTVYRGPLGGTATATINGVAWNVVGECQYQAAGTQNETAKGQSAVEGFTTMPVEGYVQMTLRDRRDLNPLDYQGSSGLTVVVEQANGKVITVDDGWQVETIVVNTQEGTWELKVESASVHVDTVS